jgi:CxxC-x17-CxxC domain-containing protein
MDDQRIMCGDCGQVFVFSTAEQEFYAQKGLASPPKRCKPCRQARKASRDGGAPRGGLRRDDRANGHARGNGDGHAHHRSRDRCSPAASDRYEYRSPAFGAPRDDRRPPRRDAAPTPEAPPRRERPPHTDDRPRYDIRCDECGGHASVPFKPIEGRQVFCQPCYRARRATAQSAPDAPDVADAGIVE